MQRNACIKSNNLKKTPKLSIIMKHTYSQYEFRQNGVYNLLLTLFILDHILVPRKDYETPVAFLFPGK